MIKLSSALLPVVASLLVASLSFGQTTFTFNDPDELESEFTIVNDGTANNWNWQSSGGLNDSGVVQIGTTSNARSSGFILNRGQSTEVESFSISTFFQTRASTSLGYHFMMGLVPGTDSNFSVGGSPDPAGMVQIGAGLRLGSTGYQFAWVSNDDRALISGTQALGDDAWYWMTVDLNRIDDSWTINMELRQATATGDIGTVVLSNSHTVVNSAILEGDAVHAFFAIATSPDLRGIDKIDNFTTNVIPEPSTVAALFGVVVLAAAILRTRSRR